MTRAGGGTSYMANDYLIKICPYAYKIRLESNRLNGEMITQDVNSVHGFYSGCEDQSTTF